jgi:hypothetical protein
MMFCPNRGETSLTPGIALAECRLKVTPTPKASVGRSKYGIRNSLPTGQTLVAGLSSVHRKAAEDDSKEESKGAEGKPAAGHGTKEPEKEDQRKPEKHE